MKTRAALICHFCGEVIWSVYRHHYMSCGCGALAIDGGDVYTRIFSHYVPTLSCYSLTRISTEYTNRRVVKQ